LSLPHGHDNHLNNFQWGALEEQKEHFFRFYSGLIKFRREHPLLGRAEFLTDADVTWQGPPHISRHVIQLILNPRFTS